ncbi:MAG: HAD family phosphatase [Nocardioidaceae bacterium]
MPVSQGEIGELRGVLFDMDGTLCDTEPCWMAAEQAIAERYGAQWTTEDGLAMVGNDLRVSGSYLRKRMQLDVSVDEVVQELLEGVLAAVSREGVEWLPGALELVEACNDAAMPIGLVTMSYANFAGAILKSMPRGRFDVVVTGDQVERGKPAPDAYLRAAELLGLDAASCIAIEDSPTGAASAESAGCHVVVVPHHVDVSSDGDRTRVDSLTGVSLEGLRRLASRGPGRT